jgi:predicted RNase H-like nuclease (RuvC/YqgF family)
MLASCGVGAQETSPDAESDDMALDLFEADRPDEEVPARKRLILEVPRLAPEEEESRPEGSEQTAVVPPAAESEHELREVVQELQEDVEMLKEEIAQLRSELRNLMPKDSQDETVVKRTVNPFWISDAQLKQLQEG